MVETFDPFGPLDADVFNFTGGARDNIIRNLLSSPRWADFTQQATRQTFRNAGFRFRDSTFNNIFNEVMGNIGLPTRINQVGLSSTPLEDHFFDSQFGLPTRYRYGVRYTFTDAFSGETITDFISLNTDQLDTIQDTLDKAAELIAGYPDIGDTSNILGLSIDRGFIDRSK